MLNNIKVSVIIPTRERAETLFYTIKTALNQVSQDYEVIVSDNCSQDNTKEIVESFSDSRIRYINPGQRLSMTDHWNFAVPYANGEYIIIIGDDDALMPNAIDRFCDHIVKSPSDIYCWPTPVYFWPSGDKPAEIHHLVNNKDVSDVSLKKLTSFAVRWGLCNYLPLPHLYHSAVHKRILKEIFEKTGSYFQTTIPDVYMSYVLPTFCDSAIDLGESISVVGHSPKSNSGSLMEDKNLVALNKFFDEYHGYKVHRKVPRGLSKVATLIMDTVFVVRDIFPNYYKHLKPNNSAMLAFLYLTLRSDDLYSIFKNRKLMKLNYSFNFLLIVLYILSFKSYILCRKVTFRRNVKLAKLEIAPTNIYEFVLQLK